MIASALTGSLVPMFTAFHTLPYVPSPSCFVTLYLTSNHMDSHNKLKLNPWRNLSWIAVQTKSHLFMAASGKAVLSTVRCQGKHITEAYTQATAAAWRYLLLIPLADAVETRRDSMIVQKRGPTGFALSSENYPARGLRPRLLQRCGETPVSQWPYQIVCRRHCQRNGNVRE